MLPFLVIALFLLLVSARSIASTYIDYLWWQELGQLETWWRLWSYGFAPIAGGAVLCFVVLYTAHRIGQLQAARGRRAAGFRLPVAVGLFLLSALVAVITIDTWTVIRYFGSRGAAAGDWIDPVFGRPMAFYLFDLPFWRGLRNYFLAVALFAALVNWVTARIGDFVNTLRPGEGVEMIDLGELRHKLGLESRFLRVCLAALLLAIAWGVALDRYDLLNSDHGFLVGVDYVDERIVLPLLWFLFAALLLAAAGVLAGQLKALLAPVAGYILLSIVPGAVNAVYVRPNEISLQRPYIERHIEATRRAYGLSRRVQETEFPASLTARIDIARHRPLIDNVRLWDWRAFHDTTTQIQALRPYYAFPDTDVDRYTINGQLRQVLLSPRELDIRQLPDARKGWINPHFIYTHGYGMVMAEANRITSDGLPVFFVQDAPPKITDPNLKLTRPEIYYGEIPHEPVFVRTGQNEFSYPSGNESVFTRYQGKGGIPMGSLLARVAATVRNMDGNILLTQLFTQDSRMMIRRRVLDRLDEVAGFLQWESDPYLVLTDSGRLVWTVDAYTVSDVHPYSAYLQLASGRRVNYMRNAVKATVDAYDGDVHLYVFDEEDPIIRAYRGLFPKLFQDAAAMPEDLRRHARYPEAYFRVQAEIYRTFHMREPQAFYNKEDLWDIARNIYGQESSPQALTPTYVVATLPGEEEAEFLLVLPFTPRNKDNMIGLMVARCDGKNLGELRFLQLSKQALIFGPMQIEARINQDQNISKDLSLWNQQGSQVLRGQMLVLPVDESFLYVEPIYIQAKEARMPQLKKVVVAVGNELIYRDTYQEAIAELTGMQPPAAPASSGGVQATTAPAAQETKPTSDARIEEMRARMQRYRELTSQGKWSEAGKELEAIEKILQRR
jgi:uncharacterized protein